MLFLEPQFRKPVLNIQSFLHTVVSDAVPHLYPTMLLCQWRKKVVAEILSIYLTKKLEKIQIYNVQGHEKNTLHLSYGWFWKKQKEKKQEDFNLFTIFLFFKKSKNPHKTLLKNIHKKSISGIMVTTKVSGLEIIEEGVQN